MQHYFTPSSLRVNMVDRTIFRAYSILGTRCAFRICIQFFLQRCAKTRRGAQIASYTIGLTKQDSEGEVEFRAKNSCNIATITAACI